MVHNTQAKPQTLKFLLKSILDKVVGRSVRLSSVLLTVKPMTSMKIFAHTDTQEKIAGGQ
jgi:hypothetical protein